MSEITNHIEEITGVTTANTDFIESAQRFAASSIPSDLMLWAITETVPGTHGGNTSNQQITLPIKTDSLIFVRRDQFEAKKVDGSMRGFIGNTASLYQATDTFPKYYIADGNRVIVKPDPDNTYTAHAQYVDYSKINEDSDLRNAVVFHASSSEFSKLATDGLYSWTSPSAPVAPASPSFTYADASVNDMIKPLIDISDMASMTESAPTYTAPVLESRVAFTNFSSGLIETDPGTFNIVAVPPVSPSDPGFTTPAISSVTISNIGTPPTYTAPVVGGDATELSSMSALDYENAIDRASDADEWDQWFATAAHLIEDEEDSELASSQLQKINIYITAYSQAMQNQLNIFNDANAEYQAKLQEAIKQVDINAQEAQQETNLLLEQESQEYSASIQKYSADLNKYQADVSKEVQKYQQQLAQYQLELSTSAQAWQKEESDKVSRYQSEVQNNINVFNKENVLYQQDIQRKVQNLQKDAQEAIQNAQNDIAVSKSNLDKDIQINLQNAIKDFEQDVQEYAAKMQKYTTELNQYQLDITEQTQESSTKYQNTQYYERQSERYYKWAQSEVTQYIQNNSKMINQTIAAQAQAQQQQQYRR